MRDEIDSRIWLAHHEAFSAFVGGACSRLRARFLNWRPILRRRALQAPLPDGGGRDAA